MAEVIARGAGPETRLRIMHGGPFHQLMSKLGMRKRGWRAFVFASFGWAIPLLILLATRGGYGTGLFLGDWGAWAKFLIAPVLFTLAEKPIGFAIDQCIAILFRIPLVSSQSMPDAKRALAVAKLRTGAWPAEAVCLLIAIAASILNASALLDGTAPGWAAYQGGAGLAGVWCLAVSNTLYWFLLTRLVWKHLIWAGLLAEIAACDLRLAVTHPDGHAGLAFIGLYPAGYGLFSLGISAVVAAGIGHVMERQTVTPTLFTVTCAGWLCMVLIFYALPLTGLASKIARLKQRAMMLSLATATDFERGRERSLLGENIVPDEAEDEADGASDVKPIYQASLRTSALLVNKGNLLSILVPALLPLLVAGASFLPYAQLGPIVKRLLLL